MQNFKLPARGEVFIPLHYWKLMSHFLFSTVLAFPQVFSFRNSYESSVTEWNNFVVIS
jgi:hypothetical protein